MADYKLALARDPHLLDARKALARVVAAERQALLAERTAKEAAAKAAEQAARDKASGKTGAAAVDDDGKGAKPDPRQAKNGAKKTTVVKDVAGVEKTKGGNDPQVTASLPPKLSGPTGKHADMHRSSSKKTSKPPVIASRAKKKKLWHETDLRHAAHPQRLRRVKTTHAADKHKTYAAAKAEPQQPAPQRRVIKRNSRFTDIWKESR